MISYYWLLIITGCLERVGQGKVQMLDLVENWGRTLAFFNPDQEKMLLKIDSMEQHNLCIFMDYSEHHRKFIMPLKSIFNKTLASLNKKCIFEHCRDVRTIKNILIDTIFVMKMFF